LRSVRVGGVIVPAASTLWLAIFTHMGVERDLKRKGANRLSMPLEVFNDWNILE